MTKLTPPRRLLRYSSKNHKRIAWATACSILNKIFDLAPPVLIGAAIDIVVKGEQSYLARLGVTDVENQITVLAIITVAIWGLESIFEYAYKVLWRNLAQSIQHDLRLDSYGHIQNLELAYFEDQSTGGLMSVLNNDINQLERFLDVGANELLQVTTTALIIGVAFFCIAPSVASFAVLPIPFVLWGSFLFQKRIAPHYTKVREQVGHLNSLLSNNLSGIATIKSFTAEQREFERIRTASHDYKALNARAIALSSAFSPLIRMVIVVGFTATLVLGGHMALRGELAVGAYSVMVFLTQRLLWPLTRLGNTFDLYQRAMASTDRIFDVLDIQPSLLDGPKNLPLKSVKGDISFSDVHFTYKNRHPVFGGLSMAIKSGQTIAIVGSTGAGKSSLVKLLLRFYDVTKGTILLDDINIMEFHRKDLRASMGFVSQEVFLFHGTIHENIAYGSESATREQVIEAAKLAEAHHFVEAFPDGYETIVGERGQKLSGGQRQRLSIARVIVKDPPILILDEATSAVDNETEAALQRSLEKLVVGRTTIIIAHRLSTIRRADQIYVLDQGVIAEQGTHSELLTRDGIYSGLWKVQTGILQ